MMTEEALYVRRRQATIAIRLEKVLYMEKESRQITIHLVDGETICFYGKYDEIMAMLDERFVHPHASYVINMQYISRLGRQEAVMISGDKIKMGGRCFGRLKRAYDGFIRNNIRSVLET